MEVMPSNMKKTTVDHVEFTTIDGEIFIADFEVTTKHDEDGFYPHDLENIELTALHDNKGEPVEFTEFEAMNATIYCEAEIYRRTE